MSSVLEEFNKSDNAGAYPNDGKISQDDSLYKMIHTYSGASRRAGVFQGERRIV